MHGANRSGRPFTGDYAGILLYETLHAFGFASRPVSVARDDGLALIDCRITNAVKCLPPAEQAGAGRDQDLQPPSRGGAWRLAEACA
jgi:uracil-DNA glycosylase